MHTNAVHGKKRRHRDDDDNLEDPEYRSSRVEEGRRNSKDALADFRAEIAEEEANNHRHRRDADPVHRSAHGEDRHGYGRSRYRRSRDQDYPYQETRRSDKRRYISSVEGREGKRSASRTHSPSSDSRRPQSKEVRARHSSHRETEGEESRPDHSTGKLDQQRGRSLSRTSSTFSRTSSNSSASRSSSASSSNSYHSRKRKRRRSRSRSRSRDKAAKKDRKSRKDRRSHSRKKTRDGEKRSVLTGKKIKLKVKKDRGDEERDAKRQELLKFLNSAFE